MRRAPDPTASPIAASRTETSPPRRKPNRHGCISGGQVSLVKLRRPLVELWLVRMIHETEGKRAITKSLRSEERAGLEKSLPCFVSISFRFGRGICYDQKVLHRAPRRADCACGIGGQQRHPERPTEKVRQKVMRRTTMDRKTLGKTRTTTARATTWVTRRDRRTATEVSILNVGVFESCISLNRSGRWRSPEVSRDFR